MGLFCESLKPVMLFGGGEVDLRYLLGICCFSLSTILGSIKLGSSLENIYEVYYVFEFCHTNCLTMKIIGPLDTFTPLYTL